MTSGRTYGEVEARLSSSRHRVGGVEPHPMVGDDGPGRWVDDASHWVHHVQPATVSDALLSFFADHASPEATP